MILNISCSSVVIIITIIIIITDAIGNKIFFYKSERVKFNIGEISPGVWPKDYVTQTKMYVTFIVRYIPLHSNY